MGKDREDQTETLTLSITKEMKENLSKISIFKATPSVHSLVRKYIRQGLKDDLAKMERERNLTKQRQKMIESLSKLLCGPPCPHCGSDLELVETSILSSWGGEIIAVCNDDDCPYFSKSWDVLREQGTYHHGYRYFRDQHGSSGAIPVGPTEQKKKKFKLPKMCKREKS
jgi:hypothetical protein